MSDSKKAAQATRAAPFGITREAMLFVLPPALKGDETTEALASVTAETLAERPAEIDRLRIIPNIDNQGEGVLAILARDFKVDWWDPNYTLQEKRQTVKDSWRVHKKLGTKAAIETAIRAIYPETTVEPWFEYEGGQPFHFRLNINITSDSGDRERQRQVLERMNYYQSLRDTLDAVRYFLKPEKSWAVAGGAFVGSQQTDRATIAIPVHLLKRPGGETVTIAGGGLVGTWSQDRAAIKVPPLKRPGGRTTPTTGGGFTGSWQRIDARASAPPLVKPKGTAERAAATVFLGSVERVRVKVNTSAARVPAGRAATACAAGIVHSYQRIRVSVGSPATITLGR